MKAIKMREIKRLDYNKIDGFKGAREGVRRKIAEKSEVAQKEELGLRKALTLGRSILMKSYTWGKEKEGAKYRENERGALCNC